VKSVGIGNTFCSSVGTGTPYHASQTYLLTHFSEGTNEMTKEPVNQTIMKMAECFCVPEKEVGDKKHFKKFVMRWLMLIHA
jgi:hypothetical protein